MCSAGLHCFRRLPLCHSGQPSKGSSNSFEPAGDRPSNLVGSVLLHEVQTSGDDAALIREAARQSPDSARDEYTGLRVNKELWQRCCFQPCGIGGNPIVDINRLARQRHFACPLQCRPATTEGPPLIKWRSQSRLFNRNVHVASCRQPGTNAPSELLPHRPSYD